MQRQMPDFLIVVSLKKETIPGWFQRGRCQHRETVARGWASEASWRVLTHLNMK